MSEIEQIFSDARDWIIEAGEVIKAGLHGELKVSTKADEKDLVTEMDHEIERYFSEKIQKAYPAHLILAEEGSGHQIADTKGVLWIIDPLDGTMNFIHQKRNFAISVAIFVDGVGEIGLIYDVMSRELFHAVRGSGAFLNGNRLPKLTETGIPEALVAINAGFLRKNKLIDHEVMLRFAADVRGMRALGAASIQIAYVACGRFDAYMSMYLAPWDFAAGIVLMNEVGAEMTTFSGEAVNVLRRGSLFVSKPGFHQAFYRQYQVNIPAEDEC